MKNTISVIFIISLAVMIAACSNKTSGKSGPIILTVSAASSMKDVLEEISSEFQEKYPDIELSFNFGASGALKQQIEQGAPADLFISASPEKYAELVHYDFIHIGDSIVTNELVLVTPKDLPFEIARLNDLSKTEIEKIAIGIPDVVPAGTYAKQTLQYENIYQKLKQKLVLAKDVRQVLTYVETGNAQAGFVYKTDAMTTEKIKVAATIDAESHEPIKYSAGILDTTEHKTEALLFFEFLKGKEAGKLWQQFGFKQINH